MNQPVTPDSILSSDDHGDDIQRRYRYQNTYTAIISLSLIKEKSNTDYIFCEQHEDILVKQKDGTFVGIQIKTRDSKEPYQASDEAVIKSLKRFIKLESQFQGKFSQYVIAVNNGFWQKKKTSNNLPYLLQLAKSAGNEGIVHDKCLSTFAQKLCSNDKALRSIVLKSDETIINLALRVLGKVTADEDLPGLDDIHERLIKEISQLPDMSQRGYRNLDRLANTLVHEMLRAASLASNSSQPLYFYLLADSTEQRKNTIIQGKRITTEKLRQIIKEHFSTETPSYIKNPVGVSASKPRSKRRIDYTRLPDLLAAGQWKEACRETARAMVKAASQQRKGWLDSEDIEILSCEDLRTIDQLWVNASNGHFGFSLQKQTWESAGGTPDADYETLCRFGEHLGWYLQEKEEWLTYRELTFNLSAPAGHLPMMLMSAGMFSDFEADCKYLYDDKGRRYKGMGEEIGFSLLYPVKVVSTLVQKLKL